MPLYLLGLMGVTRRLSHFEDPSLQIWFVVAAIGAVLILFGIVCFLIQLFVSFMRRESLRDVTGDPWGGRTLEWATSSPPPDYNFAFTPRIYTRDSYAVMKKDNYVRPTSGFVDIHMPKNTAAGFAIAAFAFVIGFALIWQMWLVAGVGFVGMIAAIIYHTFNYDRDYFIPAADVVRVENARTSLLSSHV
jgi:cytochrome o ubiquinol oxidase subunit 1